MLLSTSSPQILLNPVNHRCFLSEEASTSKRPDSFFYFQERLTYRNRNNEFSIMLCLSKWVEQFQIPEDFRQQLYALMFSADPDLAAVETELKRRPCWNWQSLAISTWKFAGWQTFRSRTVSPWKQVLHWCQLTILHQIGKSEEVDDPTDDISTIYLVTATINIIEGINPSVFMKNGRGKLGLVLFFSTQYR